MISSPHTSTVEATTEEKNEAAVCSVNTQFDAVLPDLNIAQVPEEDDGALVVCEQKQTQNRISSSSGVEHPDWLPEGWIADLRTRSNGTRDKYYIESNTGRRFRSKLEVLRYLESGVLPKAKKKRKRASTEIIDINSAAAESSSSEIEPSSKGTYTYTDKAYSGEVHSDSKFEFWKQKGKGIDINSEPSSRYPDVNYKGTNCSNSFLNSKNLELPSANVSFDNWKDMIMNGVSTSGSFPSLDRLKDSSKEHLPSNIPDNRSNIRSSWTENYKSAHSFLNGLTSQSTPHWLDRILNKPPPAGIPQQGYSGGFGLTGSFVQSPLHYLQNAGAFQNSWLNLKPPSSDYDAPWKSRSWLDSREEGTENHERPSINLNQPFMETEKEEAKRPDKSNLESSWKKAIPMNLEHREYIPYSNGTSKGANNFSQHTKNHPQHTLNYPQHAPTYPQHTPNYPQHTPNYPQHMPQHQQQQQFFQQQPHFHQSGKKGNLKNDKLQEKKRLERLGKRLSEQGLTRLFHELKDKTRLKFREPIDSR